MAVRQKKENVAENRSKLKVLGEIVHQKKVKMPTYKDNLERICKHVNVKKSVLERQNDYIDIELEALKVLRQQRLKQLTQYVFPKQEVHKSLESVLIASIVFMVIMMYY